MSLGKALAYPRLCWRLPTCEHESNLHRFSPLFRDIFRVSV